MFRNRVLPPPTIDDIGALRQPRDLLRRISENMKKLLALFELSRARLREPSVLGPTPALR
jgi:hypothetical protein